MSLGVTPKALRGFLPSSNTPTSASSFLIMVSIVPRFALVSVLVPIV